jgi:hypothetical protein
MGRHRGTDRVAARPGTAAGVSGALGFAVAAWLVASAPGAARAEGACPWVDDLHRTHRLPDHRLALGGGARPGLQAAPTGIVEAHAAVGAPARWWRLPGLDGVPGAGLRL